jgi:hypothetical protein
MPPTATLADMVWVPSRPSSFTRFMLRPWTKYSQRTTDTEPTNKDVSRDDVNGSYDSKNVLAEPVTQFPEEPADEAQTALSKLDRIIDEIYVLIKDLAVEQEAGPEVEQEVEQESDLEIDKNHVSEEPSRKMMPLPQAQ